MSSQCQGKEAGLDSHEVGGVASWVPWALQKTAVLGQPWAACYRTSF